MWKIDETEADPRLRECHFRVACDVNNPLCGTNGATYIYGPQKGVTEEMKPVLDAGMAHYAEVTEEIGRISLKIQKEPGQQEDLALHS